VAVRPTVSAAAEEAYASLGPWARRDTLDARWDVLTVVESWAGQLQVVEDIIRDTDDGPGYSSIVDADRAPEEWIPWGMQFSGVRARAGLDTDTQRARWKSTDGFRRGTPGAIVGAAQQYLIGTKTVYLVERHGSRYRYTVTTVAAETPNPAAVLAALKEQKPYGFVMAHAMTTGVNYNALRDTHSNYSTIKAKYSTYAEVLSNPTKQ
jgi:hypothetical protein